MNDTRKVFEFLQEAAIKLDMRSITAATASLVCHKFFQKLPPSVSAICPFTAAASCLFLAGKIEEDFVKLRDVCNVCYRILHPKEPVLDVGELYWNIRDGIGDLELVIIRTLGFRLVFTHPHPFLLQYLKTLKSWVGEKWTEGVAETAWTLLRDAYVSPALVAAEEPQVVALAVLFLAFRIFGLTVDGAPDSHRRPWWKVLYSPASKEDLLRISKQILSVVYRNSTPPVTASICLNL